MTALGSGSPVTLTFTVDPLDLQSTVNDTTRTHTYDPNNGIDTMVVNRPSGPAAKAT